MHCNHIHSTLGPGRIFLRHVNLSRKLTVPLLLHISGLNIATFAKAKVMSGNNTNAIHSRI